MRRRRRLPGQGLRSRHLREPVLEPDRLPFGERLLRAVSAPQWQLEQLPPWQPPQPPECPLDVEDAEAPPALWLTHADRMRLPFF